MDASMCLRDLARPFEDQGLGRMKRRKVSGPARCFRKFDTSNRARLSKHLARLIQI